MNPSARPNAGHCPIGQKFFGSFFQKRTRKILLFYKKEAKNLCFLTWVSP
jgi:hypothetical protein